MIEQPADSTAYVETPTDIEVDRDYKHYLWRWRAQRRVDDLNRRRTLLHPYGYSYEWRLGQDRGRHVAIAYQNRLEPVERL